MKREHVSEEQLRYAAWLDVGTKIGLALLVASFGLYVTGLVDPHIPLRDLPALWVLPVDRYLAETGLPTGWGWLHLVARSDVMNFIGIAFLALVTVGCYARLAITYVRRGETACALITIAEVGVLALACSDLVSGGH
jgi:hypothetical protein